MTERSSFTRRFRMASQKQRTHPLNGPGVFGMGETGLTSTTIPNGDGLHKLQQEPHHTQDRRTSGARHYAGVNSVPNSARSSDRASHLFRMANEKRARRVRFYRNGDRFFKGMIYAVSAERFRTFESLLNALTSSALCDKKVMPSGVRRIFSVDGTHRISSLEQLREGESYVCASTEVFRSLDYSRNEEPHWNAHIVSAQHRESAENGHSAHVNHQSANEDTEPESLTTKVPPGQPRPHSAREVHRQSHSKPSKSEMSASERKVFEDYQRTFVTPRLITVIRNGKRPRRAVRLLLNKRTAQSFEQVMEDISDSVKLDCGAVKKLYTLSGQQVGCLADFFQGDAMFLACGQEKMSSIVFDLDDREVRQVSAYRATSGRVKERVTLRGSPHTSSASKCSGNRSTVTTPGPDASTHEGQEKGDHGAEIEEGDKDKSSAEDKFDLSKVSMPVTLTNKYEVGSLIGTGNFAMVLECREKKTNRKYALKIINKQLCIGKEKMIDNEVQILRKVKHPNVIRLIEDFTNQRQLFYIMELVKGGDLFDAIANTSTKYTEQDAGGMLYNLASALEYLHSLHIVHRDVKPENILIRLHEDGTKSLKLGDFGLATEVKGLLYTVCGTPTYVAPEVIAESGYGVKIDVWSAGVIAYILLCGFPPFSSPTDNQDELFDLIMTGSYDFPSPYWDDVTASAKKVISRMLEIDPELRMSATQVLEQQWVASDTAYEADLRKSVSTGLGTHFRRSPKPSQKHAAGVKIMATTALDKASKFFQGRGSPLDRKRGKEE